MVQVLLINQSQQTVESRNHKEWNAQRFHGSLEVAFLIALILKKFAMIELGFCIVSIINQASKTSLELTLTPIQIKISQKSSY